MWMRARLCFRGWRTIPTARKTQLMRMKSRWLTWKGKQCLIKAPDRPPVATPSYASTAARLIRYD